LDRALRWRKGDDASRGDVTDVPAIGVVPGRIVTERLTVPGRIVAGRLAADLDRDLALLVCAERHGLNGNVAAGYVRGFGIERGALASTVGHDHHNVMAVGCDPAAMLAALGRLEAIGGGFVAIEAGTVVAELALPLGGLMTDEPLDRVCEALDRLDAAAQALGCTLPSPFMALSFLGLPVIPSLKLTDVGLIDVVEGRVVAVPWGER
jgi:adenine deaminase